MHKIVPGILEKSPEEIDKKIQIIKPFSRVVHIDLLDGKFTPETSFQIPTFFNKYKNDFFMEVHLMVENPAQYIKPFANAGFKRFLGHVEKMAQMEEFVALGQVYGEVGLALDIDTQVDAIKVPFEDLDVILLMSVKAGKSGQEFNVNALEKAKKIKEISQIPLEIDGGINDKTILMAKSVGIERFVATSYIFNSQDPIQSFERLLSLG